MNRVITSTAVSPTAMPAASALLTRPLPRLSPRSARGLMALALVGYALLLAHLIPRHEPWADEAQSWELGTTVSLRSLFGTYIHYEGSPGLWHFLLHALHVVGVTYTGLHWVCGAIACFTAALVLFLSPFPLAFRLGLPFTYFLLFQYAVVARSYVLFPALLFLLAMAWPRRWEHTGRVAVLLALLANVSAHGFAVVVGFLVVLALELRKAQSFRAVRLPRIAASAMGIAVALGFAAYCVWPARDAGFLVLLQQSVLPQHPGQALHPSGPVAAEHGAIAITVGTLRATAFGLSVAFGHSFDQAFKLGLLIWALFAVVLFRQRQLRYLIPVAMLVALCRPMTAQVYHLGLIWILFLFLLWITWPAAPSAIVADRWRLALMLALCITLAYQWTWAAQIYHYDAAEPYSPDRDGAVLLARYLKSGRNVVLGIPAQEKAPRQYFAIGLEPYFDRQPLANLPHRFWFWGGDESVRTAYVAASARGDSVVLLEEKPGEPDAIAERARLESLGYRRDRVVCGEVRYPMFQTTPMCHVFYVPASNGGVR